MCSSDLYREAGKSNCIKVINEARVALLEVGRRLANEGHIEHPHQIFMALDSELDRLVLQPDLVAGALAQREADWKEYEGLELPLFLDAPVATLAEAAARVLTEA